jgi:TetR/AcrR family transcriptional regulator, transcriptional repressor for nem operon
LEVAVAAAPVEKLTAKGRATRTRIVRAAAELMLAHGVARTTIEDIQAAAAVSTSQMYHYFADKGDLVAAVIDLQSDEVLGGQEVALHRVDSIEALCRWRDALVDVMRGQGCTGGCPIGSLASELSDTDPLARARLARAFAQWEGLLRDGLAAIAVQGQLRTGLDVDRMALAMLAAVQGGLLLSQVRRDIAPLEAAVDIIIEQLRSLGVR